MMDIFTHDNLHTLLPALRQAAADSTPVAARLHAAQHELNKVKQAINKLLETMEAVAPTSTMISRLAQHEAVQCLIGRVAVSGKQAVIHYRFPTQHP